MVILVTGGAGFIGSNFIELIYQETDWEIIVLDNLNYRGSLDNFPEVIWDSKRFSFVYGDINDESLMVKLLSKSDLVVNFAAWSFVDRSFYNSRAYIDSDICGVRTLLEAARVSQHPQKIIQISSSEVYGSGISQSMAENHPLNPASIYAASKCGGDRLAYAYWNTHKLPIVIVRPFNNYGPRQFYENWIPKLIINALRGDKTSIYGDGSATRDWLYVGDNCSAILRILMDSSIECYGEVFNIATSMETSTKDIALSVGEFMKPQEVILEETPARPGEVLRHRGDIRKIEQWFQWKPKVSLEEGLKSTIEWYRLNEWWWKRRALSI